MSRPVSAQYQRAAYDSETSTAFIVLLTITHQALTEDIRVCNNGVDVTSRGNVYAAFSFRLQLPTDVGSGPPRGRLEIDNTDRQIVLAIRQITTRPTLGIEVVLSSDWDVVEIPWNNFRLRDIRYDALRVQAEIVRDFFNGEPYPAPRFTKDGFPGLFP